MGIRSKHSPWVDSSGTFVRPRKRYTFAKVMIFLSVVLCGGAYVASAFPSTYSETTTDSGGYVVRTLAPTSTVPTTTRAPSLPFNPAFSTTCKY